MDACFSNVGWSCHQKNLVTVKHHRFYIFIAIIDQQLQKLNYRFNEHGIKLLMLSKTLDPKNTYKLFSDEDICLLVDMSYAEDFSN